MKSVYCCLLCVPVLADTVSVPEAYSYYGELPQPPEELSNIITGRIPMAVRTHGPKPDLVVLANGKLWYYINESKPGKILFSEPIELTDTEGARVTTDYFYSAGSNRLMIHLDTAVTRAADIIVEDVPQLSFRECSAPALCPPPTYHAIADFDGDGIDDIVVGGAEATTLYSARGINK
ncbi:MAG: hypothetical protein IIX90_04035 [Clostridia bacterium]|nr:hypothetical protein [Clostridia bacterium]